MLRLRAHSKSRPPPLTLSHTHAREKGTLGKGQQDEASKDFGY